MVSNKNLFIHSTTYIELKIYFIFIHVFISFIILGVLNFILDTVYCIKIYVSPFYVYIYVNVYQYHIITID